MRRMNLFSILILFALFFAQNMAVFSKEDRPDSFVGRGYMGTLPNLTKTFETPKDKKVAPEMKAVKDFNSANEITPAPRENPGFVNIILKSEKTSQYVNDLNEFIPLLENIYDLIEEDSSVQLFNAKVYYFNKSAEYFREKYENKSEAQFVSYKSLLELSTRAKSIALLRSEAHKYNPYLAYGSSGYVYNPNNIVEQLGYLKTEIKKTILILKESN